MNSDKLHYAIKSCTKCQDMNCASRSILPELPTSTSKGQDRVMLVGFNPNSYDSMYRQFLSQSNFVFELFNKAGYSRNNLWITTVIKGWLESGKPRITDAKVCGNRFFLGELQNFNPHKVIVFGADAFKAMFGTKANFSDCVNKVIETDYFYALPVYNPGYFEHVGLDSTQCTTFKRSIIQFLEMPVDLNKSYSCVEIKELKQLHGEFSVEPLKIKVELDPYVFMDYTSSADADRQFHTFLKESSKSLSYDLETTTLKLDLLPAIETIVTVGMYCEDHKRAISIHLDDLKQSHKNSILNQTLWALKSKSIIGHNLKFDLKPFVRKLASTSPRFYDTMILRFLINELELDYSLKGILNRIYELPNYADVDFEHIRDEDRRKVRLYNCRDVYWTKKLADDSWKLLTSKQKNLCKDVISDLIVSFSLMEVSGLPFNQKSREYLREFLTTQIKDQSRTFDRLITSFGIGLNTVNIKSSLQMNSLVSQMKWKTQGMTPTKTGISFDSENIARFLTINGKNKQAVTFARKRIMLNKFRTMLGKFDGKNAYDNFVWEDGRIHTNWRIMGTKTGRPSTSDPNVLNWERKDRLPKMMQEDVKLQPRYQFRVKKGRMIGGYDLSQAEIRVLTCYSKDAAFLKSFNSDADPHNETAQDMFGEYEPWQRQVAKMISFGKAYGQSAVGLAQGVNMAYAEQGINKRVTVDECEEFNRKWDAAHLGAVQWIRETEEFAVENRYVESCFGRRRHFNSSNISHSDLREAVNHPIQSTANEINFIIMNRIRKATSSIKDCWPIKNEYDAFYIEFNEQDKNEVHEVLKMATKLKLGDFGGFIVCPFKADISFGKSFATLEKIK